MPIYRYKCPSCGVSFELRLKWSEADKDVCCPKCGDLGATKEVAKTAFVLKGAGWFANGYSSTSGR